LDGRSDAHRVERITPLTVHLVNPSDLSFGTAVMTPRWLFVLAAVTPREYGDPIIVDETLEPVDFERIGPGDVVGIGIHSSNALRGYTIGRQARDRGAYVVFGGIHASLYPDEPRAIGGAHAVVKGDGDLVWAQVVADCRDGKPSPVYEGGHVPGASLASARWDLMPANRYMWGSVQTVRGCPKHCSFCSVWRTDGQEPRQRKVDDIITEIVELRRIGFRFVALADDSFYPVTLHDIAKASRRGDTKRLEKLQTLRAERFELMARLAKLPHDMVFYTQMTIEVADDPEFLDAMHKARILGALVGVESVTAEGLKSVYKDFAPSGASLVEQLRAFREHGVHVLGSFIFGLPTDRPETFRATADLAQEAGLTFAQFITLTPFPGTIDFARWEREMQKTPTEVAGVPVTRHWLIPQERRPKIYTPHPVMSAEEIRQGTQATWDRFYSLRFVWERSRCVRSIRARVMFVVISKLYRQMYANTGITTDSARTARSARWARLLARSVRRLFVTTPMPQLQVPSA
jgi:radical SAM superfamily enzyme YgiQ (UPF0313 family)